MKPLMDECGCCSWDPFSKYGEEALEDQLWDQMGWDVYNEVEDFMTIPLLDTNIPEMMWGPAS